MKHAVYIYIIYIQIKFSADTRAAMNIYIMLSNKNLYDVLYVTCV